MGIVVYKYLKFPSSNRLISGLTGGITGGDSRLYSRGVTFRIFSPLCSGKPQYQHLSKQQLLKLT